MTLTSRHLQFQFLIGTLKTLTTTSSLANANGVSIPHRYAENALQAESHHHSQHVSIPHRYAENDASEALKYAEKLKFQFLIGTLKTEPAGGVK